MKFNTEVHKSGASGHPGT